MRRLLIAVVAVGMAFGAGVSFAEEDTNHMPEKVRKFLDNFMGTWTYDGDYKGSYTIKWDAGNASLILSSQAIEEGELVYWTELLYWDGISEDGVISRSVGSGRTGIGCINGHGKVLSPTSMTDKRTIEAGKKKGSFDIQVKFNGKNQFISKSTNQVWDGEQQPDGTAIFTRVKPTTREDFEEFCRTYGGRWEHKTTLVADLPGFGKKGDKMTELRQATMSSDGKAIIMNGFLGPGSYTLVCYYDPGARQIKATGIPSNGGARYLTFRKVAGSWLVTVDGSTPDGKRIELSFSDKFSDDGKAYTTTGGGTIGGEKIDRPTEYWRRLSG